MLVRDRDGLEVLMVERNGSLLFGPGALVFPGGKLEAQDFEPGWCADTIGWEAVDSEARALRICAVRETFEETGILLVRAPHQGPDGTRTIRQSLRAAVALGDLTFRGAVRSNGLKLDLTLLTPFARWITPERQPIRFDAAFFLARAPEGQDPSPDGEETVAAEWLRPAVALRLADSGKRKLMRPTRANLLLLGASDSFEAARMAALARPTTTVLQID